MKFKISMLTSLALILSLVFSIPAQAQPEKRKICVFDVVGTNGEVFNFMKKYKVAALEWGVKLELIPYTDETVAMEDYEAGQCDGVVMTGVRNRQLVKFAGSMDMMGALPSYEHLRKAIKSLFRPDGRKFLQTKEHEVAGIFPAGAVYLFVRPEVMRTIDGTPSVQDLAGKKIAAMSYDQQALTMIRHVGGSVVGADITSFAGKFNNGSVDLSYAPAAAYEALELYKGLGEDGGVIDYTLAQLTYQITLRRDKFPNEFAQKSKQWSIEKFDDLKNIAVEAKNKIPDDKWVHIPEDKTGEYQAMFREVRQKLAEDGIYDKRMVQFLRKIRCSFDSSLPECTM